MSATEDTWGNEHVGEKQPRSGQHLAVAELALRHTPGGGRLLDIGCGVGHVLQLVRQGDPSIRLTAADAFEVCLQATRDRLPGVETLLIPEHPFDVEAFDGPYDSVVMCHSLEHMHNPAQVVREIVERLLLPGGHLILAVPNPVRPQVFVGNIFRKDYVNRGHVYAWDRSHWMNFLERILQLDVVSYGADDVILFPRKISRHLPPLQAIERAAGRLFPWWTFSNIAVIRSPRQP